MTEFERNYINEEVKVIIKEEKEKCPYYKLICKYFNLLMCDYCRKKSKGGIL